MEGNTCKISVITTVYNIEEQYLRKCIDSILNQTFTDFELILVNDCSNQETLEILQSYNDERIILINNEENLGCGMSRQIGLDNARGTYITFVDGDDWIESDYLEVMYNQIIQNDVKMVSCHVHTGNYLIDNDNLHQFLNNKIIHSSIWAETQCSTLQYGEEKVTLYRLLEQIKDSYLKIPYQGYHYTQRESSLSQTTTKMKNVVYNCLGIIENIEWGKDKILSKDFKFNYNKVLLFLMKSLLYKNTIEFSTDIELINNYIKTNK